MTLTLKRVADLPASNTSILGDEYFHLVQGGVSKKANLKDYIPQPAYANVSVASATSFSNSSITTIRTLGYSSPGDGGHAVYQNVGNTEPSHSGKFQSLDGNWWELLPENRQVSILQFGAPTDGTTDALSAFEATRDFCSTKNCIMTGPSGMTFRLSAKFSITTDNFIFKMPGVTIESDAIDAAIEIGADAAADKDEITFVIGTVKRPVVAATDIDSGVGILVRNANWHQIRFGTIERFRHGLQLYATNGEGVQYCKFAWTNITDCMFGVSLIADGLDGLAWVNENDYLWGRVSSTSASPVPVAGTEAVTGAHIYANAINGGNLPNNNRFRNITLESSSTLTQRREVPVYLNGIDNLLDFCRYEGDWTSAFLVVCGPDVAATGGGNVIRGGNHMLHPRLVDPAGSRIRVESRQGTWIIGGNGTDAILTLEEGSGGSSSSNPAFRVRNTDEINTFQVTSDGRVSIGENETSQLRTLTYGRSLSLDFGTIVAGSTATKDITTATNVSFSRVTVTANPESDIGADFSWVCWPISGGIRVRVRNHGALDAAPTIVNWSGEARLLFV